MATVQEWQRLLLTFKTAIFTQLASLNLHTRCGHLALSKLPQQAEENHPVALWPGSSESPVWVQFFPCRLLASIPYAIGRKVSQLPAVQQRSSLLQLHNLLSTAAKPSCRGHGRCEGMPQGHSSVCTTTKVIGMHRPVHYELKDTGSLDHMTKVQAAYLFRVRWGLVKFMFGFTPFLKLKSRKRGNRCVVNNICYLTPQEPAETYTEYH